MGTILTLVLAVAAFAGEIDCPGITSQPTAAGYIPNGITDTMLLLLATLV
jgi:hypothetical protein